MPLFGFRNAEEQPAPPAPAPVEEPHRHGSSLFRRNRDTSPTPTARTSMTSQSSASMASAGSAQSPESRSSRTSSLFRRSGGNGFGSAELDPSIVRAREHVLHAESSEREADRVRAEAQQAVREARIEVQRLEAEAEEEARRARIKSFHAKDISKRGKGLGRHD